MELESLRRGRRILSGVVALSAIALVMAKVRGAEGHGIGLLASFALTGSFVLLVVVWRKEYAANEAAFAERAAQQLALLQLQAALATKQAEKTANAATPEAPDRAQGARK